MFAAVRISDDVGCNVVEVIRSNHCFVWLSDRQYTYNTFTEATSLDQQYKEGIYVNILLLWLAQSIDCPKCRADMLLIFNHKFVLTNLYLNG